MNVLKSTFGYAEKVYGVNDPANKIKIQIDAKKKQEILNDHEIALIREYCLQNPDYFTVAFDLSLLTGIGLGELCALQCGDVDLENRIIHINKVAQKIVDNNGKSYIILRFTAYRSGNKRYSDTRNGC